MPSPVVTLMRNKHLLVLAVLVILVGGASAFSGLPRQEDPRLTNRNCIIITQFPGASAKRVEALVTEPIETELQEISEIKEFTSTSRAGVSVVSVELDDAVTAQVNQEIFADIRDKLADAQTRFPEGVLPSIFDDQRGAVAFTLLVGVTWETAGPVRMGVLNRVAEDLADALRNVPGTELVRLYGEPEEEVLVTVDERELALLGLTTAQAAALAAGADAKSPAGVVRSQRMDLLMEVEGALDSVTRVGETPLVVDAAGGVVRLRDIAAIEKAWRDPPAEVAMTDRRRTVLVGARMDVGQRVDVWSRDAKTALAEFDKTVGPGVALVTVFDQSIYTQERLASLGWNLAAGAAVVMVVVFFSMGWRQALLVGAALPLTAGLSLYTLSLTGGALHQMSIFGMIIALGLLIDTAIVVVDEISAKLRQGLPREEAARQAVSHLAVPLFSSTLTTILAFAPILLMPGNAGDFVGSIGGSVIMAIAASFLVSMTLIAALAGLFASRGTEDRAGGFLARGVRSRRLAEAFRASLLLGMRTPWVGVLVGLALPLAGLAVAPTLGSQFFPPVDRNMFEVEFWMDRETSVHQSMETAMRLDEHIRAHPEVSSISWLAGGSFPTVYYNLVMNRDNSPHYGHGVVTTQNKQQVDFLAPALQAELEDAFPEALVTVREFGQGPPVLADLQFRLFGTSIPVLQDLGDAVRRAMQEHPKIAATRMTMARGEAKVWLDVDEEEARRAGFVLTDLAGQLQTQLEGVRGGSVLEELTNMPVRLRVADDIRGDLRQVGDLRFIPTQGVAAGAGHGAPLDALGRLDVRPELAGVARFNGVRANTVEGYTVEGALAIEVTNDVLATLQDQGFELPPGYRLTIGGETEEEGEARAQLLKHLPVLVTITAATIILAFRSVTLAALLGVTAAGAFGMSQLATWMIGFPVSFNTILGALGLVGVTFNDNIVVLAAIRANPKARAGDHEAIADEVEGCLRHVLSTTLTTSGGFLPLLLFVGGDFWPSLSIVLAVGVLGSTLMALYFIPAAYGFCARRLPGMRGAREAAAIA